MARQMTHHQQRGPLRGPRIVIAAASLALLLGASFGLAGVAGAASPAQQVPEQAAAGGDNATGGKDGNEHAKSGRDENAGGGRTGAANSTGGARGDNGTVKVQDVRTSADDRRNEPHVCVFRVTAFGFDAAQAVAWRIRQHAPTGTALVKGGTLVLDAQGAGRTGVMTLRAGHYKLEWIFAGEHGKAKYKTFWVACGSKDHKPAGKLDRKSGDDRCEKESAERAEHGGQAGKDGDKGDRDEKAGTDGDKGDRDEKAGTDGDKGDRDEKAGKDGDKAGKTGAHRDGRDEKCDRGEVDGDRPGDSGGKGPGENGGSQAGKPGQGSEVKGAEVSADKGRAEQADSLALTGAQKTAGILGAGLLLLGVGGLLMVAGRRPNVPWLRR